MTASAFGQLWAATYPAAPPLPHLIRQRYPKQWLRIHSLPGSKRYADTAAEWTILLKRQLTVVADILSDWTEAWLVTGYYTAADDPKPTQFPPGEAVYDSLSFTPLPGVGMSDFPDPREPDNALIYWPFFARPVPTAIWVEQLLRAIARDECRAFFFHPQRGVLVAPYDGGVDIVLPDSATRDFYKHKYHAWLSTREDGL